MQAKPYKHTELEQQSIAQALYKRKRSAATITQSSDVVIDVKKKLSADKEKYMNSLRMSVQRQYPGFNSRTYLKPPVHFNNVSYQETVICGQRINLLTPGRLSDIRQDESQQRVHTVLARLVQEELSDQIMFIVFGLEFDNYLNSSEENGEVHIGKRKKVYSCHFTSGETTSYIVVDISSHNANCNLAESDLAAFPRPRDNPDRALQRGQFDILIFHRHLGVMLFEVKALGDAFSLSDELQSASAQLDVIRKKIQQSILQLNKGEKVLRYLLADLKGLDAKKIPITKGLILPNLTKQIVQTALKKDHLLSREFCQCLNVEGNDLQAALEHCIFSEQLPPIGQALNTTGETIRKLHREWWLNLVTSPRVTGSSSLTPQLYESIISRFGGPATKQFVATAHNPQADVSTLPEAVLEVSRCFSKQVLTTKQVEILNDKSPRVFLTGPPGTAKTLMLQLKAVKWIMEGHTVFVVSLWDGSEAVSQLLHRKITDALTTSLAKNCILINKTKHLQNVITELQDISNKLVAKHEDIIGQDHRHRLDSETGGSEAKVSYRTNQAQVNKTVRSNSSYEYTPPPLASKRRGEGQPGISQQQHLEKVYIVIDEAPWFLRRFVQKLEAVFDKEDRLVIWAASPFPGEKPESFHEVRLTQNLRCPPTVVKEMMTVAAYTTFARPPYTALDTAGLAGIPYPTDGPQIKLIRHEEHKNSSRTDVWHCRRCGEEVASFLTYDLKMRTGTQTSQDSDEPCKTLGFSDVLISGFLPSLSVLDKDVRDVEGNTIKGFLESSGGFLRGLMENGVPIDFIVKGDNSCLDRLVKPEFKNAVQIAQPESVIGLERAVVVVLGTIDVRATFPRYVDPWFDVLARCSSQLVIVGYDYFK